MFKLKSPPIHRRTLGIAWQVAWKHKHLWLFGFFATFASFGSVSEIVIRAFDRVIETAPRLEWLQSPLYMVPGGETLEAVIRFSPYPAVTAVLFVFAVAVFAAIFVWAITVSVSALVVSAHRIQKGKDVMFAEGIRLGLPKFWHVFLLLLLNKVVVGLGVLLAGGNLAALLRDGSWVSALFFLLSLMVFTAIALVVSIVVVFGIIEVITKNKRPRAALEAGWELFKHRWLMALETVILLLGVNVAIGLTVIAALLILAVPLVFLMLLASFFNASGFILVLTGLGAVVILAAVVAYGSFMTVFQVAAWTHLHSELTTKGPKAWLQRLADWFETYRGSKPRKKK